MTTNKDYVNDIVNWLPHVETFYVVLLYEEVKRDNLPIFTFKKK